MTVNKFQSNWIGILPLYHEWISVKPNWNVSVVSWLKSFSRMVLRKFALYNHCVRQIHKMLHDDLRDSENRFLEFSELEHLKLYAVVPATMRSFQVPNTSIYFWTVRYDFKRCTISTVVQFGSDLFCFVHFTSHFTITSIVTVRLNQNIWLERLSLFDSEYLKFIVTPNWRFKIISLSVRFEIETSH